LAEKDRLVRRRRTDGILGNYLVDAKTSADPNQVPEPADEPGLEQSEDQVKRTLAKWLASQEWTVVRIAWGKSRGVDMEAESGRQRWVIEVKGIGSRPQMRVNYFLGVLGEILFRMNDTETKYSIAVPDMLQLRSLWSRLPAEAKARIRITALFVTKDGVQEFR
jgi:hypothetical protein